MVRIDRPERLVYMQIDFDLDTSNVANAFRTNFYSVSLPSLTRLTQGRDQWTELKVRKSEFTRYGENAALTWAAVRAVRFSFLTNSEGAIVVYVDQLQLQGGFGIEGDYQYTALYRNSTTRGKGNPALDSNNVVQYTTKLAVARHPVILNVTNLIEGGSAHPGDTQIDRIWAYRKGGALTSILRTLDAPDTVSHAMDTTADSALLATTLTLEIDNNMPPTGTTRILFGPDAAGHLFLLVDGHRLYFSKAFDANENRAENWPTLNFALIGDGSQIARAGIAQDTNVFVWTEAQTYFVQGQGADTFLPVAVPNSRGIVGQFAVTSGAGLIFFVAPDGIYEQSGTGQQRKLTSAIDPFFAGETIDGQTPINTAASALAEIRLAFHPHPYGAYIIMLYPASGSATPNRQLVVKQNLQTGEFTDCFFDSRSAFNPTALFLDHEDNQLLCGGSDGHVYTLEDRAVSSDNGIAIAWQARTKSQDQGNPFHNKTYSEVTTEGNTNGQNVTIAIFYDDNASSVILSGVFSTSAATSQLGYATESATTKHKNASLDVSGSTTSQVIITRFGLQYLLLPQPKRIHDTDEITFATLHELRKILLDIDTSESLTLTTYIDGASTNVQNVAATSGRQRVDVEFPLGIRSKNYRFTLAGNLYDLYQATALWRPEPEDVFLWDSDEISFPDVTLCKRLKADIHALANVTITLYIDNVEADTRPLFTTNGRRRINHQFPAGMKGRVFRLHAVSASRFQIWGLTMDVKAIGNIHGYAPVTMLGRQAQLVTRAILQAA